MTLPIFWRGLLWVLKTIGGWLFPELDCEGSMGVLAILRCGARKIRGKRKRARSERRKNWLMARERRWRKAAKWFEETGVDALTRSAVRVLRNSKRFDNVPWHSPMESYAR